MSDIGPFYHWSPRTRLDQIKRLGPVPKRAPVQVREGDGVDDGFRQDAVCFSLDPATAWAYSHGVFQVPGVYDLWQVEPLSTDAVHVLPGWGGRIVEVRVANRIPKRRLIWVAEREIVYHRDQARPMSGPRPGQEPGRS